MVRYAQIVVGPAGAGKTTYCRRMQQHCAALKRVAHVVNLDPACAQRSRHGPPTVDIRDLISLKDVMQELCYGPNGGLVFCMEYLAQNLDWLRDALDGCGSGEDDYFFFDCPGQIELYSHLASMRTVVDALRNRWGFQMVGVYCIDAVCIDDPAKKIAGSMMALSAMFQLALPHINVMTKCDIVVRASGIDVGGGGEEEQHLAGSAVPPQRNHAAPGVCPRLNAAICSLLEDYNLVRFVPLDISREESVNRVLLQVDSALCFGL